MTKVTLRHEVVANYPPAINISPAAEFYLLTFHLWCFLTLFPIQLLKISYVRYIFWSKQNAALRRLQFTESHSRRGRMFIVILSKYLHQRTIKRFVMTVWSFAVSFFSTFCACVWQNKRDLVKLATKLTVTGQTHFFYHSRKYFYTIMFAFFPLSMN